MAFSLVQSWTPKTDNTGAATVTTAASAGSITVGNVLIAVVTSDGNGASQISAMSDSRGNTWTRQFESFNTRYVAIWTAPITTAGGTATITATHNTASANNCSIMVQEWSGFTTITKDQTKAGTGTSATPTTGASSATTQANELVIAGCVMTSTEASFTGAGAGYSNALSALVSNANGAMESAVIASTGAQTATFSWPTSRIYTAILATFYDAGGGGGGGGGSFFFGQ